MLNCTKKEPQWGHHLRHTKSRGVAIVAYSYPGSFGSPTGVRMSGIGPGYRLQDPWDEKAPLHRS